MIKNIFVYWHGGFENAPFVVKKCLESVVMYNSSTWTIHMLDEENIRDYIDIDQLGISFQQKHFSCTARSDLIRLMLLHKYGGVWCDATVFMLKPLDEWLIHGDIIREGFFAFAYKKSTPHMLSSWFLYASPGNYIIDTWLKNIIVYFKSHEKPHNYYYMHQEFTKIYKRDATFRSIWNNVPRLYESGPHAVQFKYKMLTKVTPASKEHIDGRSSHLCKLTYKQPRLSNMNPGTNIAYLFRTLGPDPKCQA